MMPAGEYFGVAVRLVTLVVPVAVYFLILGLLNSRRHPQLLSGRLDFALLVIALSPLFALPVILYAGLSVWGIALTVLVLGAAIRWMSPPGTIWVVYNLSGHQARQAVARSLRAMGLGFEERPDGFALDGGAVLRISQFPLLRNVTIRLDAGAAGSAMASGFEQAMARTLHEASAETSPMAVGLLLLATAMLVAPLSLFVQHVPTLVRLITELVR